MGAPLVSVIVPVFNGGRYLKQAVQSLLAQEYQNVEIIVVDDGSMDNSAAIIQSFGSQVHSISQPNCGVAAARNNGVAAAQGEFIAFLDQDDLWTPDKLTVQVNFLLEHPETPGALSRVRMFLEPGLDAPAWFHTRYLQDNIAAFLLGALVVRKSTFEKVGVFDIAFQYASDHDWFARCREMVPPLAMLPQALLKVRIHDANQSAQVQAIISEALSLVRSSVQRKRREGK